MRLGQLARKLSIRPSQLVDFLADKNISADEGSNTRIDDDYVETIVRHFAPEMLEEICKPASPENTVEELVAPEPVREIPVHPVSESAEESPIEILKDTPEASPEEQEVIRVQKIELSGLKVLGKIELPEPKKKEPKAEGETLSSDQKSERPGKRFRKGQRTERDDRPWRNPLEAQRKRESKALEEKQKADLERERERRKNHYQSKVRQVQRPVKKAKATKESSVPKKPVDTRPVPKTWFGKFLRWWTT